MQTDPREARLIKNEQLIRDQNQGGSNGLKKFFSTNPALLNKPVDFSCECSDLQCQLSVRISTNKYNRIHSRADRFTIANNHDVPDIEKVVSRHNGYNIVEKYKLAA